MRLTLFNVLDRVHILGLDNESMHGACLLSTKLQAYHESLEDQWTIENANEGPPIHHFLKI
jgi:hypothetical protein